MRRARTEEGLRCLESPDCGTWRGGPWTRQDEHRPKCGLESGCSHSDYILVLAHPPLRPVSPLSSSPWTPRPSSLDPSMTGMRTTSISGSPNLAFRSMSSRLEVCPHPCPSIPALAQRYLRAQHIRRCPLSPRSRKSQGDGHCYYRPAASHTQGRLQCQAHPEHPH